MTKYLLRRNHGLNDNFSELTCTLHSFSLSGLPLESLYFQWINYPYLNNFLNFNVVNYIEQSDQIIPNEFKLVPHACTGKTNINWNTSLHLRNFVSFKQDILNEAKDYAAQIAIHFRCMDHEKSINSKRAEDKALADTEYKQYCSDFLKIYNKNVSYFCSTDSMLFMQFLKGFDNVKLIHKPDTIDSFSTPFGRKDGMYHTMLELAALSLCKTIYYTKGKYTMLAVALSPLSQQETSVSERRMSLNELVKKM